MRASLASTCLDRSVGLKIVAKKQSLVSGLNTVVSGVANSTPRPRETTRVSQMQERDFQTFPAVPSHAYCTWAGGRHVCPGDLRLGLTRSQLAEGSEPFFSSLATVGGGGGGGGLFAVVMAVGSGIEVTRDRVHP